MGSAEATRGMKEPGRHLARLVLYSALLAGFLVLTLGLAVMVTPWNPPAGPDRSGPVVPPDTPRSLDGPHTPLAPTTELKGTGTSQDPCSGGGS